jgi:16S rRNA (uracil1498-N3)-methyltransferase
MACLPDEFGFVDFEEFAMMSRFFVEKNLKSGTLSFDGSEFHHMIRVTRHQVGDDVRLFDGTGREADANITFVSRHSATLNVGKVETISEDETSRLVLAIAMPKSSRSGWLVEKAVELGVSHIQPITTARSVVNGRVWKIENLRQNIVSACKQSGRSRLMEIKPVITWKEFISDHVPNNIVAIAHPGGMPFTGSLAEDMTTQAKRSRSKKGSKNVIVAIGPEGGFTVEEITQAVTREARLVSLGVRTLRVETAALTVASIYESSLMGT